jgi:hypothetical protein
VAITANRLAAGRVVWLGAGGWVESLAQAQPVAGEEAASALALGRASEAAREVVGVYAAEVRLTAAGPAPVSQKERIRAAGPSIEAVATAMALAA